MHIFRHFKPFSFLPLPGAFLVRAFLAGGSEGPCPDSDGPASSEVGEVPEAGASAGPRAITMKTFKMTISCHSNNCVKRFKCFSSTVTFQFGSSALKLHTAGRQTHNLNMQIHYWHIFTTLKKSTDWLYKIVSTINNSDDWQNYCDVKSLRLGKKNRSCQCLPV